MTRRTIAIVDGAQPSLLKIGVGDRLKLHGIEVERFSEADKAIEFVEGKEYGFILVGAEVVLGVNFERYPNLKKIYDATLRGSTMDYSEIALEVVRSARKSPINRSTPIIVASTSYPSNDYMYPNLEDRALEAGANKYVWLMRDLWQPEIMSDMEKVLGKFPARAVSKG